MRRLIAVSALLVLGACKGSGNNGSNNDMGDGGMQGGGNFTVLSATLTVAPGADCATGGVRVNIGLDNGDGGGVARDGTLQDGEIDATKLICNPPFANVGTLTAVTALPFGSSDCPFGGSRVDYGLDNGDGGGTANDGILQSGEIDGHQFACLDKVPGLLVVTTPIYPGDVCTYGGENIKSGIDNGDGGGTANDGVLQGGEVDLNEDRCKPAPAVTFTPPSGSNGSAAIDVTAANGGNGSSDPRGGNIAITTYSAAANASVEVYPNGTVSPTVTGARPTIVSGAHPVTLGSGTTSVPIVDTRAVPAPSSGLWVKLETANQNTYGWPLYDGATKVTSVHVPQNSTLDFAGNGFEPVVRIDGDLWNEGTITAHGGENVTSLSITTHHFLNDSTGIVDLRNDPKRARVTLRIFAVAGGSGQLYNDGKIWVRGWNTAPGGDASAPGLAPAGDAYLVASDELYNGGEISAKGSVSTDNATSRDLAAGGTLALRTLRGSVLNQGTIDASGGIGSAPGYYNSQTGGEILIFNGPDVYGSTFTRYSGGLPISTYSVPSELAVPSNYGPGSFASTGPILSRGISSGDGGYAGGGGKVGIRFVGGAVTSNSHIDVRGGDQNLPKGDYQDVGGGGGIFVGAYTWVGIDGSATPVVPSGIMLGAPATVGSDPLQGTLDARSGAQIGTGTGTVTTHGGGTVQLMLDLALTGGGLIDKAAPAALSYAPYVVDTDYSNYYAVVQPFDLSQLSGQTSRLQLLGMGAGLKAYGGNTNYAGGVGGAVQLINEPCQTQGDAQQCALAHLGSRLVFASTPIKANGGDGQYYGGYGGAVSFGLDGQVNRIDAVADGARIETQSTVAVNSGSGQYGDPFSGSFRQQIFYFSDTGDIVASGVLDLHGQGGITGGSSQAIRGGTLAATGFSIEIDNSVDASGGGGDYAGNGGSVELTGFRIKNNGSIDVSGSGNGSGSFQTITMTAATAITQNGALNASGKAGVNSGASGGNVSLSATSIVNSKAITVDGTTATNQSSPGYGGAITIEGGTFDNTAALSLNGSSGMTTSAAGGSIEINTPGGSQTGAISAKGGAITAGVTSTAATGGYVWIAGNNAGTIDVSGGDATASTSASGGSGGQVIVKGNNTKLINASGGSGLGAAATKNAGSGGSIEIDGTNSGCLKYAKGTGTGGTNGTLTPASLVSGTCP